uniref:CCHC-type domain-containing protein n=1 Tax=Caenorhabditis japonica TaxID=281687 RepID=A0A8R1EK28_CAEJA
MTSKTKFVIEHELEDENGQDGEHKSSIIDDKTLDVEMDCDSLEREHEARTREDEARSKLLEQDLRTYGKIAPNVAKRMIEPIRERFSQREKLIVEKGNKIFQLQLDNRVLRIKVKELQRNTFLDDGPAIKSERLMKESEERKVARYEENCSQDTEDGSPRRYMQDGLRGTYWACHKNVERIERLRGHYQATEQSFGEVKNSGNLQERGSHREKILPAQTELSLLSQLYLEQNLPEPPKYTAEEDSVSMGAFERTLAMKFGRLSTEQQVTLLETKYLAGKALKAFRGLVETEKDSVRSILRALANRLRISAEDETRRAKTRWELLRISENQSVEDFCLLLDEVARVAYRRLPPEELSSLKTAKLLEAIAGSEALRCMIDAKLLESPEKEHYDISRLLAIRHEMSLNEFGEKREVRSERDGKMVTLHREVRNFSNVLPNRQSFPKIAVQCFKCGVYGHTARICPILAEAPVQRNAMK